MYLSSSYTKGYTGESIAIEYLIKNGHKIITRNYRNRYGEIDIISLDKSSLCFTEVKSWRGIDTFDLHLSINKRKIERIINASRIFLRDYKGSYNDIQYDAIFVKSGSLDIEYYRNIIME